MTEKGILVRKCSCTIRVPGTCTLVTSNTSAHGMKMNVFTARSDGRYVLRPGTVTSGNEDDLRRTYRIMHRRFNEGHW